MPARYNASLRRIYGAIKERFPRLRTMATLDGNVGWTDMDPSLPVDIWVETYNAYWNVRSHTSIAMLPLPSASLRPLPSAAMVARCGQVIGPQARGQQVSRWRAAGKEYCASSHTMLARA